jgi:hypothetical protein
MQELKIVFPNAQRINRGGQVWDFWFFCILIANQVRLLAESVFL